MILISLNSILFAKWLKWQHSSHFDEWKRAHNGSLFILSRLCTFKCASKTSRSHFFEPLEHVHLHYECTLVSSPILF